MGTEAEETDPIEGEAGGAAEEEVEEGSPGSDDADSSSEDDAADEVTVSIGDETPAENEEEQRAPDWVRKLRKERQELVRENAELKGKLQASAPTTAVVLGPKPSLETCDYDSARFETELEGWHERKRVADAEADKKRGADEKAKADWNAQLERHSKLKSELKVKDYDDAEAVVDEALSVTQRGLIVHGADNSAVVKYALGKNPKKLAELASITDPVKFAFAVAKLETQLKVTPRANAPIPERHLRGSAGLAGDAQLDKLRAEADRTGDRTKVAAYIKKQNDAKRKK